MSEDVNGKRYASQDIQPGTGQAREQRESRRKAQTQYEKELAQYEKDLAEFEKQQKEIEKQKAEPKKLTLKEAQAKEKERQRVEVAKRQFIKQGVRPDLTIASKVYQSIESEKRAREYAGDIKLRQPGVLSVSAGRMLRAGIIGGSIETQLQIKTAMLNDLARAGKISKAEYDRQIAQAERQWEIDQGKRTLEFAKKTSSEALKKQGNQEIAQSQQKEIARLGGLTLASGTLGTDKRITDVLAPGVAEKSQSQSQFGFTEKTKAFGYSTTGEAEVQRQKDMADYKTQIELKKLGLTHDLEQLKKQGVSSIYTNQPRFDSSLKPPKRNYAYGVTLQEGRRPNYAYTVSLGGKPNYASTVTLSEGKKGDRFIGPTRPVIAPHGTIAYGYGIPENLDTEGRLIQRGINYLGKLEKEDERFPGQKFLIGGSKEILAGLIGEPKNIITQYVEPLKFTGEQPNLAQRKKLDTKSPYAFLGSIGTQLSTGLTSAFKLEEPKRGLVNIPQTFYGTLFTDPQKVPSYVGKVGLEQTSGEAATIFIGAPKGLIQRGIKGITSKLVGTAERKQILQTPKTTYPSWNKQKLTIEQVNKPLPNRFISFDTASKILKSKGVNLDRYTATQKDVIIKKGTNINVKADPFYKPRGRFQGGFAEFKGDPYAKFYSKESDVFDLKKLTDDLAKKPSLENEIRGKPVKPVEPDPLFRPPTRANEINLNDEALFGFTSTKIRLGRSLTTADQFKTIVRGTTKKAQPIKEDPLYRPSKRAIEIDFSDAGDISKSRFPFTPSKDLTKLYSDIRNIMYGRTKFTRDTIKLGEGILSRERLVGKPPPFTSTKISLGRSLTTSDKFKTITGGKKTKPVKEDPFFKPRRRFEGGFDDILKQDTASGSILLVKPKRVQKLKQATMQDIITKKKTPVPINWNKQIEAQQLPKTGQRPVVLLQPKREKKKKKEKLETGYATGQMVETTEFYQPEKVKFATVPKLISASAQRFSQQLKQPTRLRTPQIMRQPQIVRQPTKEKQKLRTPQIMKTPSVPRQPLRLAQPPKFIQPLKPVQPQRFPRPPRVPVIFGIPRDKDPLKPVEKKTKGGKKFLFFGNVPESQIEGIFGRKEITYGKEKIAKLRKGDVRILAGKKRTTRKKSKQEDLLGFKKESKKIKKAKGVSFW